MQSMLHNLRYRFRDRRDRVTLLLLVYAALVIGAIGVSIIARWALLFVSPFGTLYPHSLLAQFQADYRAWDAPAFALAPLNPEAARAAERDAAEVLRSTELPEELGREVVPVAVLPQATPTPPALTATPRISRPAG